MGDPTNNRSWIPYFAAPLAGITVYDSGRKWYTNEESSLTVSGNARDEQRQASCCCSCSTDHTAFASIDRFVNRMENSLNGTFDSVAISFYDTGNQ